MEQTREPVLWLVPFFFIPVTSGIKLRIFKLLKLVAPDFRISVISFYIKGKEKLPSRENLQDAERFCGNVKVFENAFSRRGGSFSKVLYAVFGLLPLQVVNFDKHNARVEVKQTVEKEHVRIVQGDDIYTAQYLFAAKNVRRVLIIHNIESLLFWRSFLNHPNFLWKMHYLIQALKMYRYERAVIPRMDRVFCVSEVDRKTLESRYGKKVQIGVLQNAVDLDEIKPLSACGTRDIIFVGSLAYYPNVVAVTWFIRRVLPLLLKQEPSVNLYVVGSHVPETMKGLEIQYPVKFTGFVDRLEPWYSRTSVTVVPITIGGGTRGKILESMAFGRPVVSTTIGAEGLKVTDGKDILIADTPLEFVRKILRLMHDDVLYTSIAKSGRQLVEQEYDWKIVAAKLKKTYKELLGQEGP